jgi:Tfp pilus assembly protein PilF
VLEPLVEGGDQGAEAGARIASILYDRGDRIKAGEVLKRALTTDQTSVNGLVLGARMALDRGDVGEAREYAHKAAAVAPDAPAVRQALAATAEP